LENDVRKDTRGIREQVKTGDMTIEEALKRLDKGRCPEDAPIRGWLQRRAKRLGVALKNA